MSFQEGESTYITVINFSNIYKNERFYKDININWMDFSNIQGTNCYCDECAEEIIRKQISQLSPQGIHFIDSGNYHYMSKFFMEKIHENFNLVVFDHHSDMQKPAFGNILSCGSWIMNSLSTNTYIQNVILIGVGEEEKKFINEEYREKVICIDKENLRDLDYKIKDYPVYISIDKDVLSEDVVNTNWSQGDLNLEELESILHKIILEEEVIGIDICGECTCCLDKLRDIKDNDIINSKLLKFLKKEKEMMEEEYAVID